ncbi:MAG: SDR family oxidoreductase [Saprospiraceae bacterium]|nr:SDR family oxidoreductase [Saprospiraceae bacterium]
MKALITGAGKGIGKAIAFKLAKDGLDLVLTSRNRYELEELKNKLHTSAPKIQIDLMVSDLSQQDEIQKLIFHIRTAHSDLSVLINNAGVFTPGTIADGEEMILKEMMSVNFYAPFYLTRGLLSIFLEQKKGHIINICSIAGLDPYPRAGMYCISKFAMQGFSRCLRDELKDKGIKVCTIYPGATWSNSWEGSELPESRIMQASDVAEVVSSAIKLSPNAVMEEIVLRPQLGDLP